MLTLTHYSTVITAVKGDMLNMITTTSPQPSFRMNYTFSPRDSANTDVEILVLECSLSCHAEQRPSLGSITTAFSSKKISSLSSLLVFTQAPQLKILSLQIYCMADKTHSLVKAGRPYTTAVLSSEY